MLQTSTEMRLRILYRKDLELVTENGRCRAFVSVSLRVNYMVSSTAWMLMKTDFG